MAAIPPARTLSVEQFPPEHRGWVERALLQPLNRILASNHDALDRRLSVANLNAQLFDVKVTVPDDWIPMTAFGANWIDRAAADSAYASFGTAAFRRSLDGEWAVLRGILKNTAGSGLGTTAFTFPAAFRPAVYTACPTQGNSAFANFDVSAATGTMALTVGSASSNVLLTGVKFLTRDRTPPIASCWPKTAASSLSGPAKAVWCVGAVDSEGATIGPLGCSWENAVADKKPAIRIRNVPGLVPQRKYTLTFLALGGD